MGARMGEKYRRSPPPPPKIKIKNRYIGFLFFFLFTCFLIREGLFATFSFLCGAFFPCEKLIFPYGEEGGFVLASPLYEIFYGRPRVPVDCMTKQK